MSVGLNEQKNDVDNEFGNLARQINQLMNHILADYTWGNSQTSQSLTALGYTSAEVTTLQNAMAKMWTLYQIYTGAIAQGATAHDFRTDLSPIWGFGS